MPVSELWRLHGQNPHRRTLPGEADLDLFPTVPSSPRDEFWCSCQQDDAPAWDDDAVAALLGIDQDAEPITAVVSLTTRRPEGSRR